MKVSEFKNLSKDELKSVLKSKTEELYELKVKNRLGQLANPLTIRATKKDIARVLTVISANKNNKTAEAPKAAKKVAKPTKTAAAAKVTKPKVAKTAKKVGAKNATRK